MISAKNIRKTYGKGENAFTAIDDISVAIAKSSTVAIVGKSGSGKSTLMHVMSGLDSISAGSIAIDGQELTKFKPKQIDRFRNQDIGFIFQSFFVEANQTCLQNLMVPLEIARIDRSKRRPMAEKALKAVGLEEKANVNAGTLSGGQKQRLAIARAIVNKPKIVFADEPTGNLDSATGEMVIRLLFDLNKQLEITLLIVTHDPELAKRCDAQIHIKDGKIIKTVDPKHKLTRQKN